MRRACVVGAGLGGLALAIRLQASGVATVLVEARGHPGGLTDSWRRDGFTFDAAPGAIVDRAGLAELWRLSGHAITDDVALLPVEPSCRLNWPDGTSFDLSSDVEALRREVARLAPDDLEGFDEFLRYASEVKVELYDRWAHAPFLSLRSIARAAPALARHQAWRSLHSRAAGFVRSEKLRQALSFRTLRIGGNPFAVSAIHAAAHRLEIDGGVWWARGGSQALAAAMARQFERLGGTLRLADPAVRIHTLGARASAVECASGWRERFDAVASNADVVHSYRDLLTDSPRGPEMARRLARKRFSPSAFVVHFGLAGSWPGIPHRTMLFGPRYEALLTDIYAHGLLPADMMIELHHPSVTDPSVAPPGHSAFSAWAPVANLGRLPIDWDEAGPILAQRILDEVGRRLIPDIHDRIVTRFHCTPRDLSRAFNAHLGSAFGLEPRLGQSATLRPPNRDAVIGNFYLVGAGTHPGAGVPGVLAGAKVTARLMLEDLR